jgi:hypothetical protein
MNKLQQFIEEHALDETLVMDALQDFGEISDCCIWAKEVAAPDDKLAVDWLKEHDLQPLRVF